MTRTLEVPVRRVPAALSLLPLLLAASLARAEGVESRARLGGDAARIRGASSLLRVPWGFVALGGSTLRHLPAGKAQWETIHKVPGDNLYRIAADASGRLLAAWEKETEFHLFVPARKRHARFPKPPRPGPEFRSYSLDEVYFAEGGTDAIVRMHGLTGNSTWTTVAYRYPLDGRSQPVILWRQAGHELHSSARLAVFMVAKDERRTCDNNGCAIAEIVAYAISGDEARRTVLLGGEGRELTGATPVWGSDDERVAVVVSERPNRRWLLRWRPGEPAGDYRPLPKGPTYQAEETRLTRADELVEVWTADERGLEVRRHTRRGEMKVTTLAPLRHVDPDVAPDSTVYALKERSSGELLLHWGDHLVLLPASGPARALSIEPMLTRRTEWAGADIYVPEPEALWIGIEVGGGRDFVYLSLADVERRARPWR